MRRQSKLSKVVMSATLALSAVMVAAPAMGDTVTDSWDFSSGLRVEPGTEVQIGGLAVPDAAGAECTAEVEANNGSSVHLGHNVNVYLNGTLLMSLQGIEDEPFKVSSDSEGFISSGSDQLTVFLEATQDRVASSAGSLTVNCTPPPPTGGEGCTPGYWKQTQHFDSWVATGYAPGDSFDAVMGVDSSFNTLLDGLKANGGGENALARHAVAALLNASSPDVDYGFSAGAVIALVQDAYATGDFETAKDLLEAENEAGCPLN